MLKATRDPIRSNTNVNCSCSVRLLITWSYKWTDELVNQNEISVIYLTSGLNFKKRTISTSDVSSTQKHTINPLFQKKKWKSLLGECSAHQSFFFFKWQTGFS